MATKSYVGDAAEVGRPSTKIRAEQVQSEDSFTSLAIDLAALRGQISDIIGGSEGYRTDVDSFDVQLVDLAAHISAPESATEMEIIQDLLVSGDQHLVGAAQLDSTLVVDGAATLEAGLTVNTAVADFNAGVTANEIKIDGDTAQRLYIVGSTGEIADEAKLVFDGSELAIDGDLAATNAAFAGDVSMLDLTAVSGSFSGDVSMGDLTAVIGDFSGNVSMVNLSAADGSFSGNVTISGDLTITGTTTTVDSTNLVVEDNMITLNRNETGAAGVTAGTAGVEIERGALDNALIQWEESADKFELKVGAAYADLKIDDLEAAAGTFSGNVSMVNLSAANGDFSGTLDADGAAVLGSTLSVAGVASFADAVTGSAGLKITAGLAEFDAGVLANEIKIDGDVAQRLYIVGASGEIKDEALLTFDGSELRVAAAFEATGAAVLGSTLEVTGEADFLGALDVAGQSFFAENITLDKAAAAQSILKTGGNLTISGSNDLRLATGQAMKFVDVFRESSTWSSATGVQLASNASSWTAYKNAFGGSELSLLDAIATVASGGGGGSGKWAKTYSGAAGTSVVFASGDKIGGAGLAPAFTDAGRADIYLNGQLMAAGDISSLSAATVTFTFNVQPNDVVVAVIR